MPNVLVHFNGTQIDVYWNVSDYADPTYTHNLPVYFPPTEEVISPTAGPFLGDYVGGNLEDSKVWPYHNYAAAFRDEKADPERFSYAPVFALTTIGGSIGGS